MVEEFKIIFFKGQIDTLDFFIDELLKCAERRNIRYYVADVRQPASYDLFALNSFIEGDIPVFMVTMNQVGISLSEGGLNYWQNHNIPVVDFIQDHPRNYDDILLNPPCEVVAVSFDENNIDFIRRFYGNVNSVFFLPNGGTEIRGCTPFSERNIDVLYMGGCQQIISGFPLIEGLPEKGSSFYIQVIEMMKNNPQLTTEGAIEEWFDCNGIVVSEDALLTINLTAAPYIENEVRRYFKLLGMHALDEAGIHVEIYGGDSWKDPDMPFSDNIHINPRISSQQMNQIISEAKISLCFIPWYKRGCSEKNFDSMLNGALCVSDRSAYLDTNYKDGENIVFFDLNNSQQMAADVKWLLDHPDVSERIARNGYLTAAKYDTWMNRFDQLADEIIPAMIDKHKNDQKMMGQDESALLNKMGYINRLKLYIVSCHVDKPLTQKAPDSVFEIRIQAGAALTDKRICEINDHDDCRDDISDRNRRYSEATAMYWISRHIDSDYVGILHYRRRLDLTDAGYIGYMDQNVDIITTEMTDLGISIEEDYRKVLYSADWDLFMEIIREKYPQDYEYAVECFSSHMIHPCNINVFRAELYREFSEWAFPVLEEFWRRSPEKTDVYQHRDVGFIAERLSHLFVMKMIRAGKKVIEAPLIDLRSEEWDCKKECDYSNYDKVFEACNSLYKAGQITKCCNVIGESVRLGGKKDERIKKLSEVLVTGIIERGSLSLTMHEYLPVQFRSDLTNLLYVWDALKKAISTYMALKNDESAKLLEDILSLTHFSKIARQEALRHIIETEES